MKNIKIISIMMALILICSVFASCAKEEVSEPVSEVVEVTDADDNAAAEIDAAAQATLELTDADGNVLTVIPVYNSDGVTVIAGYVEAAKDKDGNALDENAYSYIKLVIALELDAENNYQIKYDENSKIVTLTALSDENGYIIAIQDSIDIDGDKDTTEYFKAVTKVDSSNNLFIKLDKDEKGNLINVEVKDEQDGTKTVKSSDGTTQKAKTSDQAPNAKDIPNQDSNQNNGGNNGGGNSGNNGGNSTPPEDNNDGRLKPGDDGKIRIDVVLKKGETVECNDPEVISDTTSAVDGVKEYTLESGKRYNDYDYRYVVTSETDSFNGKLVFNFTIDEDIKVKFQDVNISSAGKTAVKFVDIDKENQKISDGENAGDDNTDVGSAIEGAAPKVELSLVGNNSFKAAGSGTNGTIYSECKLAIMGNGRASIDGGRNLSGICSTESISIKNTTLDIKSEAKQGISCDKKVDIKENATININSTGDGIHCNKFELNGNSTVNIASIDSVNCADGIDANDYILINNGKLNVTALTTAKYGLKVRKIIKGKPNGRFEINGGTVSASGYYNTDLTSCAQSSVLVNPTDTIFRLKRAQYTVGSVSSAADTVSYICSPSSASTVTNSSNVSKNVTWSGNIGTAIFS